MRRRDIEPGRTYAGRRGPPRTVVSLHLIDWGGIRASEGRHGVSYRHPGEGLHAPKRGCVLEVFARWALEDAASQGAAA